jgi:uncharacterized protein YraI
MAADITPTTGTALENAMPWPCGVKNFWLGLVLVGITLASGCGSSSDPATQGSSSDPVDAAATTEADTLSETIAGFKATVIYPPRLTTLATQQSGSQINLRSQPTTLSPIVGQGQSGDNITLLRLAKGEAGYSWYYVQFTQSDTEGWVRGDFVDATNAITATPTEPDPAQPVVAQSTQPCGRDRQEAHFETPSFLVYLCNTPKGLRYISTDKTTKDALITDDVASNQGIYIAIDGNQQYHISETSLALYQVANGSYSQLKGEPVLRFERFIY